MCAGEGVDDDLFGGRGILRDREPEAEDPIAIRVEECVECDGVAVARRVNEIVIGAAVPRRGVALRLHAVETSGRYRRIPRSLRSSPSRPRSTTPPSIGAGMNSLAPVAQVPPGYQAGPQR